MRKQHSLKVVEDNFEDFEEYTIEEQLEDSRKLNKIAMVIIVVMMLLMSQMLKSMGDWAEDYQRLEHRYEQLYMDLKGEQ